MHLDVPANEVAKAKRVAALIMEVRAFRQGEKAKRQREAEEVGTARGTRE